MALNDIAMAPAAPRQWRDVSLAVGIVLILAVLFLPIPSFLIDMGLAISIALSVLILMVALWIQRPLEFSSFPTILLIATMLRLSLNIATTRLILANGNEGVNAAGYIIDGFSKLVMSGDFVIGLIVFLILVVVNFVVITKGATRIAEVGARFTLDAIPGKQMAIDADLSAGLIDEKEAQRRRRELEEESSFFGSMDGASKFVRGDAIAGIIITASTIFGGIIIGIRATACRWRGGGRLRQALGRRRPRHPDPGADRLARRRPARLEGRHARLGREAVSASSAPIPARSSSPHAADSCWR
jgi:flagellar biosynthesis protein FlhA